MSSRMRRVVAAICTLSCGADPENVRTDAISREPTWCQVQMVLQAKCQRCHADPPKQGAPFPLVSYEDTQVRNNRDTPRFERMRDAVASDYMPATWLDLEPPVQTLTDNERAVLLDWADAGGKATGGSSCGS